MSSTSGLGLAIFFLGALSACGKTPRTFITSREFQGDFAGTMPGEMFADEFCKSAASTNKDLGGEAWVAWVATSRSHPQSRVTWEGPWVDPSGEVIFPSKGNLVSGTPKVGLKLDEQSREISGSVDVWTGLRANGQVGNTCSDWSKQEEMSMGMKVMLKGIAGKTNVLTSMWVENGEVPCSNRAHLICLEK